MYIIKITKIRELCVRGVREMENMINEIQRRDIWFSELPMAEGSTQGGRRPCLVISNETCNRFSPVITVVVLTSKLLKNNLPTHVLLGSESGLKQDSIALCEQIITIDKRNLKFKIGECTEEKMQLIDRALKIQLQQLPKFDEKYVKNKVAYIDVAEDKYRIYKDDFFLLSMRNAIQELINYCGQYLIDYKQFLKNDKLSLAV